MSSEDTVAGRLHAVLLDLRSWNNTSLGVAWAEVLGVDRADHATLLHGISLVLAMPEQVESTLRGLPDANHDLLLRWKTKVAAGLAHAHQLETATSSLTAQYDDATLLSLEHAADTIARAREPLHLEAERAATAEKMVVELLDALEGLDAPDVVRDMLVRHALRLQNALRLYRVSGPEAVKEALVDATAALAVATTGETDDRPAVHRFGAVLGYVADSLSVVTAVQVFYPQIANLVQQISS